MKLQVVPKQTDHLVPTPIVHQTAFWGRVHRRMGFGTEAFDLALTPGAALAERGDFLVVRSPLSNDADCAYVPYGPEIAPDVDNFGTFLERLSEELRPLLGPNCVFIRWDLPWTSLHAREPEHFAEDGEWCGPPENRLREMRMNFGTADHNLWKAPRDLLPADTVLVDLDDAEDVLLARMHHKTRYNIRLAAKRGVVVEQGTLADLPAWYELYLETMARNGLDPMPLSQFETMLDERAEGSASPVITRLLLARYDRTLLAGMLLALAPERATYLYGASTNVHRDRMPSYALQWAAIQLAKAHGCRDYDMLGAAPRKETPHHPLAGVHRFKVGFGGRLVHREGCWDFPFVHDSYSAWRGFEEAQLLERTVTR
ncbi:MAG TPA: peptidoglycan bridge formation glycyltransferase FemA/FemB family protein [Kofleriaceae bacterium]|nr:peptidoglycan bridge formation glycyltransferase FemA/FemB family protein [Kofleriaceae bacterium]